MRSISMVCSIILFISILSNQPIQAAVQHANVIETGMYTSFNDGSGGGSDQSRSPGQLLQRASQLGDDGKVQQALEVARRGYKHAQYDPTFVIGYIDLLNNLAMIEGEVDKKILNEAIRAADSLHKSKICNGQTDAEMSYHFMVAMGALADNVIQLNDNVASQLYTAQGKIARNLRNNPGYPSESLEVLGQPLVNLAQGYAIKGSTSGAVAALTEAFEIGFTQFDSVLQNPLFDSVDGDAVQSLVNHHRAIYRQKVKQWSQNAVANFQPFKIKYDVAAVNGGRISSNDSLGHVAVIDLWATWCEPCRESIPHFVELQRHFEDEKVDVIGISMDDPENPAAVVDTVKSFGIDNDVNYELAVGTDAIKQQIPGDVLLPTTIFVDQTGTVRYIAEGFHDYDQLAAITELLNNEAVSAIVVGQNSH